MVKGANSLFDVFSKILENLNEYIKSRFIQKKIKIKVFFSEYIEGNEEENNNEENEDSEYDEDFNEYDIYLNKCIKNNIF